ncbi:MAG: proprotein convertase P-domain-containing protein, partial [Candidatus Omnitrophica bacterium]|nr:proprotein convertase P-domain-containing protein [Candidatus Omnitrophota bacterium]
TLKPNFEIQARIYDTAGNQIVQNWYSDTGTLSAKLLTTGTYYVYISDVNYDTIGDYQLNLQRMNNPPNPIPIAYGVPIDGSISKVTEIKAYTFTATANDQVYLAIRDTTLKPNFEIQARIYDTAGNQIVQNWYSDTGTLSAKLLTTGTYYVYISDVNYDTIGDYQLNLQRMNNPPNPIPIAYGVPIDGSISKVTEIKAYTFTATANDQVYLAIRDTTLKPNFEIQARIYDTAGNQIVQNWYSDTGTLSAKLLTTGTYYIYISDVNYDTIGDYQLNLQRMNNPPNPIPIAYGVPIDGSTSKVTEIKAYTFTADAGTQIYLTYEDRINKPNFEMHVILTNSSGSVLSDQWNDSKGMITTTLADLGNYYIFIMDVNYDAIGDFRLTLKDNIIRNVSVNPSFFNPALGQSTKINYTLTQNANVTIDIYYSSVSIDGYGDAAYNRTLLKNLFTNSPRNKGVNTETWDGKDQTGKIARQGVYTYVIRAVNSTLGRDSTFDPGYVSGGVAISNRSVSPANYKPYSNETVQLNYTLSAPAWVTIGSANNYNLPGFIIQGAPRNAGANTETWDGRDGNGNIFTQNLQVAMKAVILPEVCSVLRDDSLKITDLKVDNFRLLPVYSEVSTIKVTTSKAADLTLTIVSPNGSSWIIAQKAGASVGENDFQWDGTDPQKRIVNLAGNYRLEVQAAIPGTTIVTKRTANITVYK